MITHIVWFRKDLRLEDNTAFYQALDSLTEGDQLLCLFHLNSEQYKIGKASHDYFFTALSNFKNKLAEQNIYLHLITGDIFDNFLALKKQFPTWKNLYFNSDNRGFGQKRDLSVIAFLEAHQINVYPFEESHLHLATEITKSDGTPYKKFTPYYKKWLSFPKKISKKLSLAPYIPVIAHIPELTNKGELELSRLLDLRQQQFTNQTGEDNAFRTLNSFVHNRMKTYHLTRDFPAQNGTSQLSFYLSTGQISIRKVWQLASDNEATLGQETFLKELAWRDFYQMIYYYHPNQFNTELITKYQSLEWQSTPHLLKAWQDGQTGYPIIDAAMKQLNQTGWMHNRLRMLTASFLTKDLLIDWRLGEKYFSDNLIDYDAASNIGGWQWAASTGTDAVPYFRLFNPTTQSMKFDKEGVFIKKFLPELASVPSQFIHEPSKMPLSLQQEVNCHIGKDYPTPIVDHTYARKRALEWFQNR